MNFLLQIIGWKKVQEILNQKYNKDGIAVYVKQVDTGKTAGIHEDQEMYSASIAKLLYLYYTQKRGKRKPCRFADFL